MLRKILACTAAFYAANYRGLNKLLGSKPVRIWIP